MLIVGLRGQSIPMRTLDDPVETILFGGQPNRLSDEQVLGRGPRGLIACHS
jgi:hypothetical protein